MITTEDKNKEEAAVKERQRAYRNAIATFTPQENATSPNYVRLIEWCKENGYTFKDDVSYNGFIYVEKYICEEDSKIVLKVYDGIKKDSEPSIEIYNVEANFGDLIMSETTYSYRMQDGLRLDPHNLDELFTIALEIEQKWEAEWVKLKATGYVSNVDKVFKGQRKGWRDNLKAI